MSSEAPTRYVKIKDAQQAVSGREIEIVQAVGISWRQGQREHIRCPYPHHGGDADWRLNKHGRAICTCTGGKTDSVFDIVAKVEGLEFEDAKIRCVEILGEHSLIKEKTEGGNFQATDARSLLSAPPQRRDDALPRAYLAHRLGLEPDAVLMPTTPAVGLRALGYFDPPKGRGKPVLLGEFPCAVFGQVDAEGHQHAHRIYVAPGGAGKADLGERDGRARDPKKSAKVVGDESTAGRAVMWGDPTVAPWGIIAEGIETAAAVADAFREEIGREEAYVASGINAGGIEAFGVWPATKRITIAADRDEAATAVRPSPTRRGEKAARVFGIRNYERVSVAYALPGEPGTGVDWLDVHGDQGRDAVRKGILGAARYTPTREEVEAERERIEGVAELQRIERAYPLPEMERLTLSYERTPGGKIWVHQTIKSGDDFETVPITSPFGFIGRLRFADEGDAYGLRIVVEDMGGRSRNIDVSRSAFARMGAAETKELLFEAGLRVEGDGEVVAVKCLKAADPQREITVVRRPGWHDLEGFGGKFFVCPSGRIIGASNDNPPELSVNSRISPAVAIGGNFEGWKDAVAAAASATRCPHWTLGVAAGFAAPLTSLLDFDTNGFNLSGATSGGKTTAQRLAVSAWSRAALDRKDSLLQSARATANGVEMMAARSNGSILAMDELGHVGGRELGKIIYSLASGTGKVRMTADAKLRPSHTWSTFVLLSAEKSLEEKVRGDGGEWYGGMAARIPDVDITGVDRAVDQAILARIQAVDRHFGHAGPAFIEKLIAGGFHERVQELRDGINRTAVLIAGAEADGALIRAALPFAIVLAAGRLARQFDILPATLDVDGAVKWAWARFKDSSDAVALDPETLAISNLRAWIAERWGVDIQPTIPEDGQRAANRNAMGWFDDDAIYIPSHRIIEAAGGALKEAEIAKALSTHKLLAKTKGERHLYVDYIPKIGQVKSYALRRSQFRGTTAAEPQFTLHEGGRR